MILVLPDMHRMQANDFENDIHSVSSLFYPIEKIQ